METQEETQPTIEELLAQFNIETYVDEEGETRLKNTNSDYGEDQHLEDVTDDDGVVDPEWVVLDPDIVEEVFYVRGDGYGRDRGPAFNVKLDNVYWETLRIGDALGIDIPDDIDMGGWIWSDTVSYEREYFETWMEELYPALDTDRFTQVGRSGGHLVYVKESLTLAEAYALQQLEKRLPDWVKGIGTQIAMEYARFTLQGIAEETISEHRGRFVEAMMHAAVDRNIKGVRQALEQIDYLDGLYPDEWAIELAEEAAYKEEPKEEVSA